MRVPSCHMVSRLPERLPVGATYVVEGSGGEEGNFRVIARYIVLPGGQRLSRRSLGPACAARCSLPAAGQHQKISDPYRKPEQKNRGPAGNRLTGHALTVWRRA